MFLIEIEQEINWAKKNSLSWDGKNFEKWRNHRMGKQLMNINVPANVSKTTMMWEQRSFRIKTCIARRVLCTSRLPVPTPRRTSKHSKWSKKKKIVFEKPVSSVEKVFLLWKPLKLSVEAQRKSPPKPVTPQKEIEETKPSKVLNLSCFYDTQFF